LRVNDTSIDRPPLCGLLTGKRLERCKVLPGTGHTQFLRPQCQRATFSFIRPATLSVFTHLSTREGKVFGELAGARRGTKSRGEAEIHLSARCRALRTLRHLPDHVGESFGFASGSLLCARKLSAEVCGGS
jgi:hypothetical protein